MLSDGTQQIRNVVFEWTGEAQGGCAWAALRDPFVARVVDAYPWLESGGIAAYAPHASHRLMEGLSYYRRAVNICHSKQLEIDREQNR